MIAQTVAAIWWAATVSADVRHIKEDVGEIKDDAHQAIVEQKSEIKAIHKRIDYLTNQRSNGRG